MKKNELLAAIKAAGSYKSLADAEHALKAVTTTIKDALVVGTEVAIPGFGKFESVLQKGKSGKVPGTAKTYTTQDKRVPKFKASSAFKDLVAAGK